MKKTEKERKARERKREMVYERDTQRKGVRSTEKER